MDKCIYNDDKLQKVKKLVKSSMSARRYVHSMGVEHQCHVFAYLYGMDKSDSIRMRALGILHDFTKELSLDDQIRLCKKYDIELNFDPKKYEKVLHGWTAAKLLADKYPDFVDEEMCCAIRSHTVGNDCMSLVDRILYLSDYIEPSRKYSDCVKLRRKFNSALKRLGHPKIRPTADAVDILVLDLMISSFDMTVKELVNDGKLIFPDTISTRNSLMTEKENIPYSKIAFSDLRF